MARVAISKELVLHVKRAVEATYAAKEREAEQFPDWMYRAIYDALLPKHIQEKMAEFPHKFFYQTGTMRISLSSPTYISVSVPGPMVSVPETYDATMSGLCTYSSATDYARIDHGDPRWSEITKVVVDRQANIEAVRQEKAEAVSAAARFLAQYTSLAPALKAWPALWELLPEWAKQKHKVVAAVKPKAPPPSMPKVKPSPTDPNEDDALVKLGGRLMVRNLTGKHDA